MPESYRSLPPIDRLEELFLIRDGKLINRIPRGHVKAGEEAGGLTLSGYLTVGIDRRGYRVHRIIWALTHKRDPGQCLVDHIDRDKLNNHPDNLRLLDKSLNALNAKPRRDEPKGVYWHERDQRWMAKGWVDRKMLHLGSFRSKEEAIAARQNWEAQRWQVA
jgi:hypothetical protein